MLANILLIVNIILKKESKMGKKNFKKNNDKKTKIIFEKLTVKEESKIFGGNMHGTACLDPFKPLTSDCAFNQ
jgi:hypothetical protein